MTMFGVGFRVEAKAEITATLTEPTDNNWDSADKSLTAKLVVEQEDYPTNPGDSIVYEFLIINQDEPAKEVGNKVYVALTLTDDSKYGAGVATSDTEAVEASKTGASTEPQTTITTNVKATRNDILNDFASVSFSTTSRKYTLELIENEAPYDIAAYDEKTVTVYKITARAVDNNDNPLNDVKINEGKDTYLLPGQSGTLSITTKPDVNKYSFMKWTKGTSTTGVGGDEDSLEVYMSNTSPSAADYKVWYKKATEYSITVTSGGHGTASADKSTAPAGTTITLTATPESGYKLDKWESDDVTISGNTFTMPSKAVTVKATFKEISPSAEHTAVLTSNNSAWGSVTPSKVEDSKNHSFTIKATNNTGYYFKNWTVYSDDTGSGSLGTFGDETSATTTFTMGDKDVIITAMFQPGSTPTPVSDAIKVTKGQKVYLYTDYGVSATTVTTTGGYVSAAKAGSDFEVVGKKSTSGSEKAGLIVDGNAYNVIVYTTPSLTFDTSTSSSSFMTIEMPTSVYHHSGDTFYELDDVDEAALIVSSARRGNSSGWSYTLSGSGNTRTRKITFSEFSNMINKVASGSEDVITIKVHPIDPDDGVVDEYVYDDAEFTVYKISLDGSGGASYKVNDKDVGDYFYAIDGMEYKITATNKSGYTNTIEKWDGVSFGTSTSGTASFGSSKTIKATFKSSTSSSSSSSSSARSSSSSSSGKTTAPGGGPGTGGDYDDVPKTGESKTDIWILWSVLFISILGAGFMIYKRFGLVKAIARAEEEAALVEREERVEAEKKEKKEKMDLLKSLRDL